MEVKTTTPTINISTVQERINQKAEERFMAELEKAARLMKGNEILRRLMVKGGTAETKDLYFVGSGSYGLFSERYDYNGANSGLMKQRTNYEQVREELIRQYAEEETTAIFSKLEEISAFMEGGGRDSGDY